MTSPPGNALIGNYIKWALSVKEPMTIEYSKRMDFVTVKIPLNFITNVSCRECVEDGPHITSDHVFQIILTTTRNGSHELRMINRQNNGIFIPPDTAAFKSLKPRVMANGNQRYFYGRVDEDDRTTMYINIISLPRQ